MRPVWTRLSRATLNRIKGSIEWNPTFAQVPVDYGFGVEPCWPRRANQKGSVENLVRWVKGSFFKVRHSHHREDLQRQLHAWLEEVNTLQPTRVTHDIAAERMTAERRRLSPRSQIRRAVFSHWKRAAKQIR